MVTCACEHAHTYAYTYTHSSSSSSSCPVQARRQARCWPGKEGEMGDVIVTVCLRVYPIKHFIQTCLDPISVYKCTCMSPHTLAHSKHEDKPKLPFSVNDRATCSLLLKTTPHCCLQAAADAELFARAAQQIASWHEAEMAQVQSIADRNAARVDEVVEKAKVHWLFIVDEVSVSFQPVDKVACYCGYRGRGRPDVLTCYCLAAPVLKLVCSQLWGRGIGELVGMLAVDHFSSLVRSNRKSESHRRRSAKALRPLAWSYVAVTVPLSCALAT
eukprot:1152872-Pelagomonas_calceolata.AAC.10